MTLIGAPHGPVIDTVQVDAAITETHEIAAEVMDYPIERGSDLTDHRRVMPRRLSISGVLSEFPVSSAGNELDLTDEMHPRVSNSLPTTDALDQRYRELLGIVNSPEPFQVVTGLEVYPSMSFISFRVTRDKTTGGTIRFEGELREVLFASSLEVEVKPSVADKPRVEQKKVLGPKQPAEPNPSPEPLKSTAKRLKDWILK